MENIQTRNEYQEKILDSYYDNTSNFDVDSISNSYYNNIQNLTDTSQVCIIIPTYNEAHNILTLLNQLYSEEQRLKYDERNILMQVLVVDDNSPDGTADVVKTYQKNNPQIYILERREKNGLGAAYIAGMQHAMKSLRPDIIFEMDGDLSHGPEYVLPMIEKIGEGADFVIGSRYIKGGSIPENWGIKRKLISKGANLYVRSVLRIKDVNDCTGGFRAIKTSALEQIDFNSLKTKGYAFQISLLEEMRRNNAIMREVPIAFKDRTNGTSKMRMQDILEEGLFVLKARLENIFYPKKRVLNIIPVGQHILNANTKNRFEISQDEAVHEQEIYGLGENQYEFLQSYGLEEPIEIDNDRI